MHTRNRRAWVFALGLSAALAGPATGQTSADRSNDMDDVRAAAADYLEGWFTGDAERMKGALRPELVKQIADADGTLQTGGVEELVEMTRRMGQIGTSMPESGTAIRVLDIFETSASVRVDTPEWIDYLHLTRDEDRWRILHVLWDLRSGDSTRSELLQGEPSLHVPGEER